MSELGDVIYCIDTSALVDLMDMFPISSFPTLWENLGALVDKNRLIAPLQVLEEVKQQNDKLLEWVKSHSRMFRELDREQTEAVEDVVSNFPDLTDSTKETDDADPFVIALTLVENNKRQQSFFPSKCVVITQEKWSDGKPKIPNACKKYKIEWISIFEFFKRENWDFKKV